MLRFSTFSALILVSFLAFVACSGNDVANSVKLGSCRSNSDCPAGAPECDLEDGYCFMPAVDGDSDSDSDKDSEIDQDAIDADFDIDTEVADLDDSNDSDTQEPDADSEQDSEHDLDNLELDADSGDADDDTIDSEHPDRDNTEAVDGDSDSELAIDNETEALENEGTIESESELPCQCTNGDCCENCRFKAIGSVCLQNASYTKKCEHENTCRSTLVFQTVSRVCSGTSAACDGALVENGDWQNLKDCLTEEKCAFAQCVVDINTCCDCTSGECCRDFCKIMDEGEICKTLGSELGCPYGSEPGVDAYTKYSYRTCAGNATECNGAVIVGNWNVFEYCNATDTCQMGRCVPASCYYSGDCPFPDFYCRKGTCHYTDDTCRYGGCDSDKAYCNEKYGACFPISFACEVADDCINNPAGTTCDPKAGKCVNPPNCNLDAANCYPGTQCKALDELLGYKGNYCINCSSDSDCYPGTTCHKRALSTNVCAP